MTTPPWLGHMACDAAPCDECLRAIETGVAEEELEASIRRDIAALKPQQPTPQATGEELTYDDLIAAREE